jgi:hypothetical protein
MIIKEIGSTAGEIWYFLEANGETSWRQIEKRVNRPQRQVAMGIGWLAREDKVNVREEAGVYYVALKK